MTDPELCRSGLLVDQQPPEADGVYLGAWKDRRGALHYLRDISNGHVLIGGPTRSGKGVSCIMPTLLSLAGGAIVHDEKTELWAQTAEWRREHVGPVLRWEPGARSGTISWNPLIDVRLFSPHEFADTLNIALMLVDARGHGLDRLDHWAKAAIPVLAGCVLHELYLAIATGHLPDDEIEYACPWMHRDDLEARRWRRTRPASLAEIANWFADPGATADDLWEAMRDNTHLNGAPHPVIAAAGRSQTDRSDRERSSVTSTLLTHLTLFFDDIVRANTSFSDFHLNDIADGDKPITIYVTALPNDTVRLRPLIRLFLTMAMRSLMSPPLHYINGQPTNPHRHETLFVFDEFPSLGKLEEVETDLARAAGWGVKFLLSIQDMTQLDGIYGKGHSLTANCHTRAFFPTNDLATAEILSKSTGMMTVQTPHTTIMGRRLGFMSNITQSIQPTARPLMTAGEILAMRAAAKDNAGRITEPGEMLIFLMGHHPLKTQQMLYFQDPIFRERAGISP